MSMHPQLWSVTFEVLLLRRHVSLDHSHCYLIKQSLVTQKPMLRAWVL